MSVTLGDVKTALQARGYGTDTTAAQTEFVKGALRRVYAMRRWRFLEAIAITVDLFPGDDFADISSLSAIGIDSVRLLVGGDLVNMDYVPEQTLLDTIADDPQTGQPELWTRQRQDWLQVWPTADAQYTLHIAHTSMPTLPAADSDVLTFPDEHVEVLVEYAVMQMAKRQRDWQTYNAAKADFQEALQDMIRGYSFAQRQTSAEVERWSGWDQVER